MNCRQFLILTGYDYSRCFTALEGMDYQVVMPANEPMLSSDAVTNMQERVGDKLVSINYGGLKSHVQKERPNVLITFGWRRLIPATIVKSAKLAVNIHPAILPQYRGYHPVPHVLVNREKFHGITAHMITDKMDDGEIIYQVRFEIDRFATLNSIQDKVNEIMPSFLRDLCVKLSSGKFELKKNDERDAKVVAGKRTPEDSEIPLSMEIGAAYDFIRSCDEDRFPAYIVVEGKKVQLRIKVLE